MDERNSDAQVARRKTRHLSVEARRGAFFLKMGTLGGGATAGRRTGKRRMLPRYALAAALALAALLIGRSQLAAQTPIDPPAQSPAPPGAPPPAGAPVSPEVPPPAREPLPEEAEPPAAAGELEQGEPVPAGEPGPPEVEAPPADPADAAISAAPLQVVPEPWLPEMDGERHQLEAYRAAARGEHESALGHYELALASEPDNLRWGAEYRQVAIAARKFDRALRFFAGLAERHPQAPNLHLNFGYAYIDKVPSESLLAQMSLAGNAVREFGLAIGLEESFLAYYSRGSCYVYFPPLFGRAALGVADLERALELAKAEPRRSYHARAWAALGDGFWRLGKRDAMRAAWRQGLELFPRSAELAERLGKNDADLDAYLIGVYQLGRRVDTGLEEIWQAMREEAP